MFGGAYDVCPDLFLKLPLQLQLQFMQPRPCVAGRSARLSACIVQHAERRGMHGPARGPQEAPRFRRGGSKQCPDGGLSLLLLLWSSYRGLSLLLLLLYSSCSAQWRQTIDGPPWVGQRRCNWPPSAYAPEGVGVSCVPPR